MTDIDFRRLASLLILLRLYGTIENPIQAAVRLADELADELRKKE